MSLVSYAEARPWATAIREQVASKRMPPWGAVAGVGDFANDPSLTTPEIDLLIAWAEGGAPEGDPSYLPARVPGPLPPTTIPHSLHSLRITRQTTLTTHASIVALRPERLGEGGSLECWAVLPNQRVERLIWLRDYRSRWTRDYVFHDPVRLPAGTSIEVRGTGQSALKLMVN